MAMRTALACPEPPEQPQVTYLVAGRENTTYAYQALVSTSFTVTLRSTP